MYIDVIRYYIYYIMYNIKLQNPFHDQLHKSYLIFNDDNILDVTIKDEWFEPATQMLAEL